MGSVPIRLFQGERICEGILVETFRESGNNALGLQVDCGNTTSLLSSRMDDLIFDADTVSESPLCSGGTKRGDSETVFDTTQTFKEE